MTRRWREVDSNSRSRRENFRSLRRRRRDLGPPRFARRQGEALQRAVDPAGDGDGAAGVETVLPAEFRVIGESRTAMRRRGDPSPPEATQASDQARRIRRVTSSDEFQAGARPSFASGTKLESISLQWRDRGETSLTPDATGLPPAILPNTMSMLHAPALFQTNCSACSKEPPGRVFPRAQRDPSQGVRIDVATRMRGMWR